MKTGISNTPFKISHSARLKVINMLGNMHVRLGLGMLLLLCLAIPASAGDKPLPGNSKAYGKTLAQWQETFWRWAYGQISLPQDQNGNAVADGVVMMGLPSTPADGTPGSIDITLSAGQPFVLPLWNVLGTSYDNGTPVDPAIPLSVFQTMELTFKVDGVTVIGSDNLLDYYSQFQFVPTIPLPGDFSPYLAVVWLQGVAAVHTPLPVGDHTLTLDAKNTQLVYDAQGFSYTYEFHNTWHVSVTPK
jgi:hypothetical protein